jgi:hypothetical protein
MFVYMQQFSLRIAHVPTAASVRKSKALQFGRTI